MSATVLSHKLEAAEEGRGEAAWNVRWVPAGLGSKGAVDRLFVASEGAWRGYFVLSESALYTPEDEAAPWTLLFDARSWTPIEPVPVKRFRGLRPIGLGAIERPDSSQSGAERSKGGSSRISVTAPFGGRF